MEDIGISLMEENRILKERERRQFQAQVEAQRNFKPMFSGLGLGTLCVAPKKEPEDDGLTKKNKRLAEQNKKLLERINYIENT